MKAFVTAFALLGFVAASTIPVVARADTQTTQTSTKKHIKKHKSMAKNMHHHSSKAKHKKPAATG
jgi:hypothetical protein